MVREIRRRGQAERSRGKANAQLVESVRQLGRHGADLAELNRYGGLLLNCGNTGEAVELTTRLLWRLLPEAGGTVRRMKASADHAEALAHWGVHVAPAQCWALRRGLPHLAGQGHGAMRCEHIQPPDVGISVATACVPWRRRGPSWASSTCPRTRRRPMRAWPWCSRPPSSCPRPCTTCTCSPSASR